MFAQRKRGLGSWNVSSKCCRDFLNCLISPAVLLMRIGPSKSQFSSSSSGGSEPHYPPGSAPCLDFISAPVMDANQTRGHSLGSDRMESVLGRNWSQRIPWYPSRHLTDNKRERALVTRSASVGQTLAHVNTGGRSRLDKLFLFKKKYVFLAKVTNFAGNDRVPINTFLCL